MKLARILKLMKKEFLQLRRDRRLLGTVLIVPIFQLFVFGYAVTTDVKHINTAVFDQDKSASSRRLVEAFSRSPYFDYRHYLRHTGEIDALLDSGRAQLVLHIPAGFAEDLAAGRPASLQIVVDGSDSMTASIISGYAGGVVRRFSEDILLEKKERLRAVVPSLPAVEGRLQVWFNPELKSVNYMVPGVVCMILLVVTMILTSVAIVKEREIGTLEQLVVTPITPRELMLGKSLPFVIIGLVDLVLVVLVAAYWFKVPIAGSLLLLFSLTLIFLLSSLGLGLFISTVSHTQQQATMTSFFVMMPFIILSGFLFPVENMPPLIQHITYLIPLRYFLEIIRGIFLKGVGISVLWPQALALAGFGVLIISLSALRFKKRLG